MVKGGKKESRRWDDKIPGPRMDGLPSSQPHSTDWTDCSRPPADSNLVSSACEIKARPQTDPKHGDSVQLESNSATFAFRIYHAIQK